MAGWKLSLNFGADAEVAGGGVLTNILRHLRPPVIPAYQFQSFPPSGMPSNLTIMVQGYNFPPDVSSGGNIDLSAEVQYTFSSDHSEERMDFAEVDLKALTARFTASSKSPSLLSLRMSLSSSWS